MVIDSGSEEDEDEDEDEPDVEEDEDDEDEEEDGEEDAEGEDEEDAEVEDEEEDAEGSSEDVEVDANGDTVMEDNAPPPPPVIRMRGPASKPSLTVTPAREGKIKSVEAKETQPSNSDDDEELSELDSAEEAEGREEDADGEDIGDDDQDMDQDDNDLDSDGETPGAGSRGSTPDVTKMTKRQQSRLNQVIGSDFLQLPMGKFVPSTPIFCDFLIRRLCHEPTIITPVLHPLRAASRSSY